MPEPIYPEYIPLEDEHEFLAEEQPLPPIDSPTAESPGYVTESDPEEDPRKYEKMRQRMVWMRTRMRRSTKLRRLCQLLPFRPRLPIPSTKGRVERLSGHDTLHHHHQSHYHQPSAGDAIAMCMALPAHSSPLLPSSGCPTQIQTLRISSTQALIDAVTAALPSPPLPPLPPSLYIPPPVDRRDDILESEQPPSLQRAVPEIAPMTVGEVNTRVTELAELHKHDTQDLYALLEDAHDIETVWMVRRRPKLPERLGLTRKELVRRLIRSCRPIVTCVCIRDLSQAHQPQATARVLSIRHINRPEARDDDIQAELLAQRKQEAELLALREPQRRARQPGPEARIPDHQEASGDADSHI
ncbi:hypothetical protein Tco_0216532 [Tanacetum coccineum]